MYAIVKIEEGKPVGWMISNRLSDLKARLTGDPCFDNVIQKERKALADSLPHDDDVIHTPQEYNGYWLLN